LNTLHFILGPEFAELHNPANFRKRPPITYFKQMDKTQAIKLSKAVRAWFQFHNITYANLKRA